MPEGTLNFPVHEVNYSLLTLSEVIVYLLSVKCPEIPSNFLSQRTVFMLRMGDHAFVFLHKFSRSGRSIQTTFLRSEKIY